MTFILLMHSWNRAANWLRPALLLASYISIVTEVLAYILFLILTVCGYSEDGTIGACPAAAKVDGCGTQIYVVSFL